MTDENYIVLEGWMVTELGLSGRELLVYALIYGFSQGGSEGFTGNLKYIEEWTGVTKKYVISTLSSLVEKDLIEKYEEWRNKVKFCRYVAKETTGVKRKPGWCQNDTQIIKENSKESFQKENTLKSVKEKVSLDIPEPLKEALDAFAEVRKKMRKPMTEYALKLIINKLNRLAPGDIDMQVAIVNQSIECGYQGVFAIKEDQHPRKPVDNRPRTADGEIDYAEMARRWGAVFDE